MKNISKLLVGILFSALAIAPTYAGELSVSGGATATYSIGGDSSGSGKTLGISNELDFSASGELDNGMSWNYQVQLDNAAANNDDTRLEPELTWVQSGYTLLKADCLKNYMV